MKVYWKQQITKPCWEVKTIKHIPQAREINRNDVPDKSAEYTSTPVNGRITVMEGRFGEFSLWERLRYFLAGHGNIEEMVKSKYSGWAHIEDVKTIKN